MLLDIDRLNDSEVLVIVYFNKKRLNFNYHLKCAWILKTRFNLDYLKMDV